MNKLKLVDYNLERTLLGGQAFTWDFEEEFYYGFTQKRILKLKIEGEELLWQTFPKLNDEKFLKEYLRLEFDYAQALRQIKKDPHMEKAILSFPGLRLLKQEFELTVMCFIISAFNNIKKIRGSVRKLSQMLGECVLVDGKEFYLFPTLTEIASADEEVLKQAGVGYRAKYLKAAAKYMLETELSNKIQDMDEESARMELKKIPGIGDKVADCILIFSLQKGSIAPMDVWTKRIFTELYKLDNKISHKEARVWVREYFGEHGALAGQFLFEYIRTEYGKISDNT